tara:strand:+ start:2976 stop:3209 length:234 start_codon:yes stop_codon:yes gene_type:complete
MTKITGMQIRMARTALKWRVDDLSKETGVGWARIQNMEKSNDKIDNEQINAIKETLQNKGIEFLEEEGFLPFIKIKK